MKLTDNQAKTAIINFYEKLIKPYLSVYNIYDDSYLAFLLNLYTTLTTNDYPTVVPDNYYNSEEYAYTSTMGAALESAHRGYIAYTTNNKEFGSGTYGSSYQAKYLTPQALISFLLPKISENEKAELIASLNSKSVSNVDLTAAFALTLADTPTPSAEQVLSLVITAAGEPFSFDDKTNITLQGTDGIDLISLKSSKTDYKLSYESQERILTASNIFSDASITAWGYERVKFSDGNFIAFDIEGVAGQAYRLYKAAFDRVPDKGGLGYWINELDNGGSLQDVASSFMASAEFQRLNGTTPPPTELVTGFYQHVLGRLPDQGGLDYWLGQLNSNVLTPNEVLVSFSESAENKIALSGQVQQGIEYTLS